MPRDNEITKKAKEINDNQPKISGKRLTAPKHLSEDERKIWKEVVAAKPIDFFPPESINTLEAYCRHKASLANTYALRICFFDYNKKEDIACDKDLLAQYNRFQTIISRETKSLHQCEKELGLNAKANSKPKDVVEDDDEIYPG